MGNVFRILLRDFKRLLKAPAAMIVVGALLVLPSLYTWYNVVAFWNPYDATGNLKVCVVNQDAGVSNDLVGQLVVGDKLVEQLESNKQLNWVTDEGYDMAMEDLKVGKVYAVYVVPEDFSACLISPLTGETKSPHIDYYANEKLGPVSPKITDTAASTLERQINSTFVATVTEVATQAVDDAIKKAEADISAAEAKASNRSDEARSAVAQVRETLSGIAGTIDDARTKVTAANNALGGASTIADDMRVVLRDVTDEAETLQSSLASLSSESVPALSNVLAELSQVTANASALADAIASSTGEAQADVDMAAAKIQPVIDAMWDTVSDLEAAATAVTSEKLRDALNQAASDMSARAEQAQVILDDANALAERMGAASQTASEAAKTLNTAAANASDSLVRYSNDLHGTAASAVDSSVAQVGAVCAQLSAAVSSLEAAVGQVRPVFGQLDGILADCGSAVSQTDTLIGGVQSDLDAVMSDARMLAQSNVISNLLDNGTLNAQNISEFMGSPTKLETTKLYHPNAYGAAMAPLFMNLTFWIGAFMLVIIFLLEVDSEGIEDPKPWQRYLGRFLMFCIFAVVQALVCCAGTLALGVQAANVPALFVAAGLTSLAFMSLIYALSATFRHVGKALCIILVFAQIPGASGLYPVEMTSSFFQAIYPLLPFTYGIDAMRESLGGFYGNSYAYDMIALGVFFFVSLGLGLLLGPLMTNVVRMTARQIHEGDLYNGEDTLTPERPYRMTHVLRALTERESYREELEARYARFSQRYPIFIRGAIVLGAGIPIALGVLLALDAVEKVVLLTLLLLWLIGLIGFLVVVESLRYSFERQLNLEDMSEDQLLRVFSRRNRMVHTNARWASRGKSAAEEGGSGEGEGEGEGEERAAGKFEAAQAASRAKREAKGGMPNVLLIARRDFSGLFKNVMSVVITLGLVVLPSLFAWYNILACWNVFDNTSYLSVAVASEDEGYESDLLPLNINVGEKVVSALRGNDQINWVFTNGADAVEGVKAGKYYAALVIPKGFSEDMLTFYEGDSASATIDYYVNEKKNAIAPNITGMGADAVSHEVNAAFANTLSEVAIGVAKSLSQIAQDNNADARVASLAEHARSVADRLDQSANVLGLYSSLSKDSQSLVRSGADTVSVARERLQAAAADIDAGKERLRGLVDDLSNSVDSVRASMDEAESQIADLEQRADTMISDVSGTVSEVAEQLRDKAFDIDAKADTLTEYLVTLEDLRDELKSGVTRQIDVDISNGKTDVDLTVETEVIIERTILLDKDIAALRKAIEILHKVSAACTEAADSLDAGTASIAEKAASLSDLVKTVKADAAAAKEELVNSLEPGIEQLRADIATLVADLEQSAAELQGLDPDLEGALESAASALGDASAKIDDVDAKLHATAQRVRDLADAVDTALASGNVDKLRSLLQGNAGDLAAALTAPVKVQRTALFPSENFGSAMTPLYCTLALFIGALLIMVAMKPEVSRRGKEELVNPKPRELYFGRFMAVAAVSLMQTTLLGLGNMLFLKVQVSDPVLFMLGFWFSGLVLAFIIYTLVVAFGNLGKAIAVLLLIVQVTACGGSFPLQLLPDFVQAISPWVPATYIVDILRAAMMGVCQNDYWVAMGFLALFIVPFLLLGLVLRKPLERFMKFYVRKVEECKIMG